MGVRKKSKKKTPQSKLWMGLFLLGILIFIYPIISQLYYKVKSDRIIGSFEEEVLEIDKKERERKLELANAYNKVLDPNKLSDPYHEEEEKEAIAEYARMIEVREMIGHVEVPKIGQDLPIYAGTSDEVLNKGAGHLEGTSLPVGGKGTHTVITAHRGLSRALMFRELDRLKKGDVFFLHTIAGTLAYEVDKIQTVEPYDFEPVLVVEKEDYATLVTCTPYMINSHRLLVRGHRIPYTKTLKKEEEKKRSPFGWLFYWIVGAALVIGLFSAWAFWGKGKKKRKYGAKDEKKKRTRRNR